MDLLIAKEEAPYGSKAELRWGHYWRVDELVGENVCKWHDPDMGAHRSRVRLVVLTGSVQR